LQDVTSAIEADDAQRVRVRAGRLHKADLGLLIASLEPELRPKLVEMMGAAFDFAALTEMDDNIREEILAELPNETVAEGVRDLERDDAVSILADLEPEDQAEILEALSPAERCSWSARSNIPSIPPAVSCRRVSSPRRRFGQRGRRSI
jgi:magnesium transporter